MKKIFKFKLKFADRPEAILPINAEILTIDKQGNSMEPEYSEPTLYIWAIVDDEETQTETRRFRVSGTGHPLGDFELEYINTFFIFDDSQVYHVFEIKNEKEKE